MVSVVAGIRFFEADASKGPDSLARLRGSIENKLLAGCEHVFVAVNQAEDKSGATGLVWGPNVTVFPVETWGFFVNPLNAILTKARSKLAMGSKLLIVSTEVQISPSDLKLLQKHMDENTLVVGGAVEGHDFSPGVHTNSSGTQVPWNTISLWDPKKLWVTGFPMMGDGPIGDEPNKGVEELITIALLQKLNPTWLAKLIKLESQTWDTSSFGGERLKNHLKKMASKRARPAAQLEAAGFKQGPVVIHI